MSVTSTKTTKAPTGKPMKTKAFNALGITLGLCYMVMGLHFFPITTILVVALFWSGMILVMWRALLLPHRGPTTNVASLEGSLPRAYDAITQDVLQKVGLPRLRLEIAQLDTKLGPTVTVEVDARRGSVVVSKEAWTLDPDEFRAVVLNAALYERSIPLRIAEWALFAVHPTVMIVRLAAVFLLGPSGLSYTEAIVVVLATYCLSRAFSSILPALSEYAMTRVDNKALTIQGPLYLEGIKAVIESFQDPKEPFSQTSLGVHARRLERLQTKL